MECPISQCMHVFIISCNIYFAICYASYRGKIFCEYLVPSCTSCKVSVRPRIHHISPPLDIFITWYKVVYALDIRVQRVLKWCLYWEKSRDRNIYICHGDAARVQIFDHIFVISLLDTGIMF